jgi:hypothetical protein
MMPAYLCNPKDAYDEEDYGSRVVFAGDQTAAEVAARLGQFGDGNADEFDWDVKPEPRYDHYESTGFGLQEMVDEGWRVACSHCDHNVNDEDREDEHGNPVERGPPIVERDDAYCDQKCVDAASQRWQRGRERKAATIAKAKSLLGDDIEIVYASGASKLGQCSCQEPDYPGYVEFTFPGSQGKAECCPWCETCIREARDADAWKVWRKSRGSK